ncbi:MAG: YggS family pyridoxal phosphate-dependent enzyme [Bacteroidales bacterium]|nr:YggS family pyridoxal phosphate-dependent enzyme [Lentimicrobiaceae bacterium]MDD5694722.1 YggS family pyridoxal phosphate-dependent enzyme [Bacteroidales bacterium]
MGTEDNFIRVKNCLPEGVTLVVVSKTRPADDILRLYRLGHKIFGENKAQELIGKQPLLPGDIQWHFIGHLQTNKVKYIAPFVHLIESVDSLHLLSEIEKQAKKQQRIIDFLLQLYIATEETKFGLSLEEAEEILQSAEYRSMEYVRNRGVMGMASLTDDRNKIRQEFRLLKEAFHHLKMIYFSDNEAFSAVSMGMSGDWEIAVEEGATIVRIGTAIFGERVYSTTKP